MAATGLSMRTIDSGGRADEHDRRLAGGHDI
jgi:hypothetical protein